MTVKKLPAKKPVKSPARKREPRKKPDPKPIGLIEIIIRWLTKR